MSAVMTAIAGTADRRARRRIAGLGARSPLGRRGWRPRGRYLDQLARVAAPGVGRRRRQHAAPFAGFLVTEHPTCVGVADDRRDATRRLQGVARRPARRTGQADVAAQHVTAAARDAAHCSSNGSSSGTGPTPRHGPDLRRSTARRADDPLPKFLDDATPPSSWPPPAPRRPARPARRRAPGPHRDARRRALRPRRRRRRAHRRRHWLRVPVGKLHNDRYVPLHPDLVELLTDWTADNPTTSDGTAASSPTTAAPSTATDRPDRSPRRPTRRHRPRPPPPAAPHPRHPSHQPRDAPRSDRRAARPPQPAT